MSDETKKEDPKGAEWQMPQPVFRSSPGKTPNGAAVSQEEIPTEPGFSDRTTEEVEVPAEFADRQNQTVRPSTKVRVRHKKKGGCARAFVTIVSLITVAAIVIIGALIYFLFYYRPAETVF